MNIADLIKQMSADPTAELFTHVAKVKEVDETKRTVDVEIVSGSADLFGCRLQAEIEKDKGIVIIPKKDSFVLVTFISKNHAFVSLTSEIEKVIVDFPELTGDVDKIVLNGGDNEGIVKVIELTDKLNALEKDMNTLKSVFSGWTPISQDGGAALKSAAGSWFGQQLTITNKTDIQNDKIKH